MSASEPCLVSKFSLFVAKPVCDTSGVSQEKAVCFREPGSLKEPESRVDLGLEPEMSSETTVKFSFMCH